MVSDNSTRNFSLSIAALGVVYGDIGTSPLYAIKEAFSGAHHPIPITPENVLGILSLIFWSLMIIVSIKYATFVTRADNHGEGGIMALMALVQGASTNLKYNRHLIILGLFGSSLFYGDSVITPAISVLSAIEGIDVITPMLKGWVVPITLIILFGLFAIQKHGTGRVGTWFGPITGFWFIILAILGIINIITNPVVITGVIPTHAISFFMRQPTMAFLALGAVVLAVTGAEALYADMGHFGRGPVRLAWFSLVLPALVLNYFGQGALLLTDAATIESPFYRMAPAWMLVPLVILATAATVIASQAVITGAFSLTHQAIQLGYAPFMSVQHTSAQERGQIYLPGVNWALFIAVAWLVLNFGSSNNLAAAYGIAVTGTMLITTILLYLVAVHIWRWNQLQAMLMTGAFLVVDSVYFAANIPKIMDGGWFPLVLAGVLFIGMTTWKLGRETLKKRRDIASIELDIFSRSIEDVPIVNGTAVFLTPNPCQVPHALLHSLKHYKCLHEKIIILSVMYSDIPHIPIQKRMVVQELSSRLYTIQVEFGFMDSTDDLTNMLLSFDKDAIYNIDNATFFLGRETLIPSKYQEMTWWQKNIFIAQARNSGNPASYFGLPPNRVVELGAQILL
ncbi:potassium transport protein Kup [Achromatium sp. WMS2]|nr:potassium transport protein Kup [Achromatium sp. WMS2]